METEEAKQALVENLERLRDEYSVHEGNGGDADRRRITVLVCDLLLDLEPEHGRLLHRRRLVVNGKPAEAAGAVGLFLVTGYGEAGFEKALYDALYEYNFECDPTPYEADWKANRASARTIGERSALSNTKHNPLKLHCDNSHQPVRPYPEAVEMFPVMDLIINTLLGYTIKEERDAGEQQPSGRFDLEERHERTRVAEAARCH